MSGQIFKNTPVSANQAIIIQNDLIDALKISNPGINVIPIGSVGHRNIGYMHNDIDIAVEAESISELEHIVSLVFGDRTIITKESLYIVSMNYEYEENKHIQVDFIQMTNPDWTKFRYFCPEYNESKYKVGAKIMLTNMLLNHCTDILYAGIEAPYHAIFDYSPIGLLRTVFTFDNNETIIKETEFVTDDPDYIIYFLFGEDGKEGDFKSIETLWEAIHSDRYKYQERLKMIEHNWFVNCYKKGWTSIKPEDFELKYWDVNDIKKTLKKHEMIHTLNLIFNKDEEGL